MQTVHCIIISLIHLSFDSRTLLTTVGYSTYQHPGIPTNIYLLCSMKIAVRLGGESMDATALSEGWEEREVRRLLDGGWTWCLDGDKKAANKEAKMNGNGAKVVLNVPEPKRRKKDGG